MQENNGGNSGNSRCQVQTYEMSEGTLVSAYVLHLFQTLVPRFQNEEDSDMPRVQLRLLNVHEC